MAWIRTVRPHDADGMLARSYDAAVARAGRVFQILQVMSVAPTVLDASIGFYRAVMFAEAGLSRRQREMLAVVTSRTNRCHY